MIFRMPVARAGGIGRRHRQASATSHPWTAISTAPTAVTMRPARRRSAMATHLSWFPAVAGRGEELAGPVAESRDQAARVVCGLRGGSKTDGAGDTDGAGGNAFVEGGEGVVDVLQQGREVPCRTGIAAGHGAPTQGRRPL
jgi:hypothetical protein